MNNRNEFDELRAGKHKEYLRCLLWLEYGAALHACRYVHTETFDWDWHAKSIHAAIEAVASREVAAGHPKEALLATDVNAELVATGQLSNASLQRYWNDLAVPNDPRPLAAYRIKELAARVNEHAFRAEYHKVFSSSNEHTTFGRPLSDLNELIAANHEHLRSVYKRTIGAMSTLQAVAEQRGDAA